MNGPEFTGRAPAQMQREWATLLHGACDGWAALLVRSPRGGAPTTRWYEAGALPPDLPEGDVWLSVATFRERGQRLAARAWNVPGAWVDIDPPKGADGPTLTAWRAAAQSALRAVHPAPTAVVDSGRGFHAYWLFLDLVTLAEPARAGSAAAIVAVNRALAARLGGDLAATDLARVLRLPGTRNPKPGGGWCGLLWATGPRYRLGDLAVELGAVPTDGSSKATPSSEAPPVRQSTASGPPPKAECPRRRPGRPTLGATTRDLRTLPPWARELVTGGAWRAGRRYCASGGSPDRSRADLAAVGAMVRAGWPDTRITAAYLRNDWLIGVRFRELRDREGLGRATAYLARTVARARQAPAGGPR